MAQILGMGASVYGSLTVVPNFIVDVVMAALAFTEVMRVVFAAAIVGVVSTVVEVSTELVAVVVVDFKGLVAVTGPVGYGVKSIVVFAEDVLGGNEELNDAVEDAPIAP